MRSNRVLGKGLSALIPDADLTTRLGDREVRMLPSTAIGVNTHQPRKTFNDNGLRDLASSVGQVGILQPILVRRLRAGESAGRLEPAGADLGAPAEPPEYCLVAGERRLRAAGLAGLGEVPAIICSYEETEALKVALLENIQREDLNPIEEAAALSDLLERYGATQEELAGMLGKNRSSVANTLRLLALEDEIQQMMRAGELSRGHAKALLGLDDGQVRLRLARLCRARGLSVRECERRVQGHDLARKRAARRRTGRHGSVPPAEAPEVRVLRERTEHQLGAPVVIERDAQTKHGAIVIKFYSDDDLERLLALMGVDTNLS